MLFWILTVFASQLLSAQGSYDLHIEDVVIAAYSEEYFTEPDAYIDDTNAIVVNVSIIKQLPTEAQGHFSLFGASMGEFVIDTGIDVTLDLCDILNEPIMMGPLFAALGFDPNSCPPDVGVYGTDGYRLQMDTLPDDFPPNKYRVILEILYQGQELLALQVFPTVVN
ncbi:GSCOCG00007709001-RA-CDS [Cotesia congregata]|nr:GSCOCG00007709001-RA-CDS [Cotesia congregata]